MIMPTFYIDGTEYTLPCSMEREVYKRQSDNAGYLMDGHFHNDVLGTYARYTVKIAVPLGEENQYANLHELLAQPVSEYTFTMPYNQDFITFKGMVNRLPDRYYTEYSDIGGNLVTVWRNITFEIEGTEPIYDITEEEE